MKRYLVHVVYKDSFGKHTEVVEIEAERSSQALLQGTGKFASVPGTTVLRGSAHPIAEKESDNEEEKPQEISNPQRSTPTQEIPPQRLSSEEID